MRVSLLLFFFVLAACTSRSYGPVQPEAREAGDLVRIFIGTTREKDENGRFGFGRDPALTLNEMTVSIPPVRAVGTVPEGGEFPDPAVHFAIADLETFETPQGFQNRLGATTATHPSSGREVTVFVHGYNTNFAEAAFRAAQVKHDVRIPGETVVYSWPSRASPLGYQYDDDSILFARDGLEKLLRLTASSGPTRIVLVGHSMGSYLLMETLRQLELAEPGWVDRNASGVILIAPDLDTDVFRSQLGTFETVPDSFGIFVSRRDRALRLSARIAGEPDRLGNLQDVSQIADLPVTVIDVTAFADDGDDQGHFLTATSPALIAMIKGTDQLDQAYLRGRTGPSRLPGQRNEFGDATQLVLEFEGR